MGTCRKSIFPLAGIVPIRLKEHRRADNIGKEASNSAYLTWRKGTSSGEEVFFSWNDSSRARLFIQRALVLAALSLLLSVFFPLSLSLPAKLVYIYKLAYLSTLCCLPFFKIRCNCVQCVSPHTQQCCARFCDDERGGGTWTGVAGRLVMMMI